MAAQWHHQCGAAVSAVYPPEYLSSKAFLQEREHLQHLLNTLAQMPEQERATRLDAVRKKVMEHRAQRQMEYPNDGWGIASDDWLVKDYHQGRFNFWAYIDDRDAAQAAEKALTADYEGSHPLFVVNDQNSTGYSSAMLAKLYFPDVPIRGNIEGANSLVSIEKAKSLIGYQPEYPIPE